MRIPSGTTDQYIYFVALDATDFTSRETGLSSFTVYRSRDGGAAAAFTTPTVNETDATNMPGVYELLLDEDMTIASGNDSEEMVFHITHAGMAPVTRTIELYRPKITAGETLTVASSIIPWPAAWDAEVQSEVNDGLTAFWTSPATLVDLVWDEVLTGGTHNVVNSAGRRLRNIQDFGTYSLASVWVDEVAGTSTGTTDGEDATVTNRSDDFDNAQTVADSINIQNIQVTNDNSITLTAGLEGYNVFGNGSSLALGSQNLGGTILRGFGQVTGIGTSTANSIFFVDCILGAVTLAPSVIEHCGIGMSSGTFTVGSAGNFLFIDCYSKVAGSGAPVVDLGAAVGATTMEFRRWSGGLTLNNVQTGDVISVDVVSGGTITVNGTGGTVTVRGHCNVVDGSGGSVTIAESSVVNMTKINAEVASALATYNVAATTDLPTNFSSLVIDGSGNVSSNVMEIFQDAGASGDLKAFLDSMVAHNATAQGGSTTSVTLNAGASSTDDYYNCMWLTVTAGTGQGNRGRITDYDGTTKVATVDTTWVTSPTSGSTIVIFGEGDVHVSLVNTDAISASSIAASALDGKGDWATGTEIATAQADLDIITGADGVNLLSGTQTSIDAIEADTNELQTDWVNGGRLDLILDTAASAGSPPTLLQSTTIATLASQTSFTLTAGSADDDAYNGAIAVITDQSTSTQKAVGTVSDYTGSTKTITLAADPAIFTMAVGDSISLVAVGDGSTLTNIPWNASWDAEVQSEVNDAIVALHLDHLVSFTGTTKQDVNPPTDTVFETDLGIAIADLLIGQTIVFTSGSLAGVSGSIADYDITEAVITLSTALPTAPSSADDFVILTPQGGGGGDATAANQTSMASTLSLILQDTGTTGVKLLPATQSSIDAIEADTNEIQGDLANGGRIDLILDATLADTNEIQTDLANGGRIDLLIDAILEDTGTTLPAAIPSVGDIDTELTSQHGSGSWSSGGSGSGARTVTVTVDDGTNPIENAIVRFTEGLNTFTGTTDASGNATFNLDDATYTVAITKGGYSFAGASEVISADATPTYSMTATSFSAPSDPSLCRLHGYLKDNTGSPIAKAYLKATLVVPGDVDVKANGNVITNRIVQELSDADGLVDLNLIKTDQFSVGGCTYSIEIAAADIALTGVTLTTATKDLADLV